MDPRFFFTVNGEVIDEELIDQSKWDVQSNTKDKEYKNNRKKWVKFLQRKNMYVPAKRPGRANLTFEPSFGSDGLKLSPASKLKKFSSSLSCFKKARFQKPISSISEMSKTQKTQKNQFSCPNLNSPSYTKKRSMAKSSKHLRNNYLFIEKKNKIIEQKNRVRISRTNAKFEKAMRLKAKSMKRFERMRNRNIQNFERKKRQGERISKAIHASYKFKLIEGIKGRQEKKMNLELNKAKLKFEKDMKLLGEQIKHESRKLEGAYFDLDNSKPIYVGNTKQDAKL